MFLPVFITIIHLKVRCSHIVTPMLPERFCWGIYTVEEK